MSRYWQECRKLWAQKRARAFAFCSSATTAIEYTLIAAGISVAIAATVAGMGSSMTQKFQEVDNGFTALRGE
ncbi:MAG: Flp family type IVb pilin [Rhodobiaceae bacterium]|nr:Flp family type IVb pilin [Rhodobiaceae bacterium]MCC0013757.1 Flp family type IVb pilin [Rhodobiaceae bacterium]MCC0018593.1 Flp family type IVb pilin [Rhodobiaceae bacterium]MCC0062187.1 Flp family type IVb pilin [Rhodobiaceae bacterium]